MQQTQRTELMNMSTQKCAHFLCFCVNSYIYTNDAQSTYAVPIHIYRRDQMCVYTVGM